MSEHEAPAAAAPTQVEYPWRATARTLVQAVIGGLVMVLADRLGLSSLVADTSGVPSTAAGGTAALAGIAAAARIMALPEVNDLLTRWGLGAAK
jgi:hypothetical protein